MLKAYVMRPENKLFELAMVCQNGESYQKTYRHDGTTYYNNDGQLPVGVTYKEYVVPPATGTGPGAARIVVGSDNQWYYTPDHYRTFYKFIP